MEIEESKGKNPVKIVAKLLLIILISFLGLIGATVLLLAVYENDIKNVIVGELNKSLNAEVQINPENINITILKTFPDCSIEFKNLLVLEALPIKQRDTLLFAGQLNLHFNAMNIWNKKYEIEKVKLKNAYANLIVLKNGKNNYTFWKSNPSQQNNDSVKFKLNLFDIESSTVKYKNKHSLFKTELQISTLSFKGNFENEKFDFESKADIEIKSITQNKITFLKNKKLLFDFDINVNANQYIINKAFLNLNQMKLDLTGDFIFKDSLQNLNIDFNAPDLEIQSTLSLLPETYKLPIKDYNSKGNFYMNGKIKYQSQKNYSINTTFGIKDGEIVYKPKDTKADSVNIIGEIKLTPFSSTLNVHSVLLKLNNDELSGNFTLSDFSNPFINCKAQAKFNLNNLQNFCPIDTISSIQGNLNLFVDAKGLLADFQKRIFSEKVHLDLDASISALQLKFKNDPKAYTIENASVTVREADIIVHDLLLKRGQSDLKINGKLPKLISAITNTNEPLIIEGNLFSNQIVLEDFLPENKSNNSSNERPIIPENIQFKLNAAIMKFNFGKFESKNITGDIECKNQKIFINDFKLQSADGDVEINAFADNSNSKLKVTLQSNIKNKNVNTMFTAFNNFGQNTLIDNNIKGIASATIDFEGTWNNKLEVDEKSIATSCKLIIDQGELIDFKPLLSLANYVDVAELKRIKFSKLQSKIDITNRTINIAQTSIKNSVLNINFWGTHTFDHDIDYHIQLLISEYLNKKRKNSDEDFGPIENDASNQRSAFILMTGNINKPIIKYDRQGLKQKIKSDLKAEKQNLKQILKEEFDIFKKDTSAIKKQKKAEQVFELEKPIKKNQKNKEEIKKDEDDGDF